MAHRARHEQSMRVLRDPPIARRGKAEKALDDEERMFDFSAHARFGFVLRPFNFVDHTLATVASIREILGRRRVFA